MKRYFIYILLLMTFEAWTQNRAELWTKGTFTKKIDEHWSLAADFQYRSQANYRSFDESSSIFYKDLAYSARLWVFYKLPKSYMIHLAPIAYFANTDIINETAQTTHSQEIRSTFGIAKTFSNKVIKNRNRFLYEARLIDCTKTNPTLQQRLRLQNTASLPLFVLLKSHQFSFFAYNEFFVKYQKNIMSFDQNRIVAALQYQYKGIELVSGYQHIIQNGSAGVFQRKIWLSTFSVNI